MEQVKCVGLIPAEREISRNKGVNVLVMAINNADSQQNAAIRIFGSESGQPKVLTEKGCTLGEKEHAHLYFHVPPACFGSDFWDGEAPEELTLFAGKEEPETSGELIFVND